MADYSNSITIHDIREVKEKLPTVKVQYLGAIIDGDVSGRMNDFATVTTHQPGYATAHEISWATIVRAYKYGGKVCFD